MKKAFVRHHSPTHDLLQGNWEGGEMLHFELQEIREGGKRFPERESLNLWRDVEVDAKRAWYPGGARTKITVER